MIINWSNFLKKVEKVNCLWVGETHGITGNYKAYQLLIQKLIPLGFSTVALEMPEDFEKFSRKIFLKYGHYFDGRFSENSLKFFEWLEGLEGIKVLCFDVRTPEATQKKAEEQMALNLLSKVSREEKFLVLTGSFHSGTEKQQAVLPMAGYIKEKLGEKLMVVELKYKKGYFYNFGLRRLTGKFHRFDDESLSFGKITSSPAGKVGAGYFFHCSRATPVTLLEQTIKERLKDLYEEDQKDRKDWKWNDRRFLKEVGKRDKARRTEVEWLLTQGKKLSGEDYYYAAMIYQHGDFANDYRKAHVLAKKAVDKGYGPAKWLCAASLDRYLLSQGKSQKYGTQYKRNKKGKYELFPPDLTVMDAQRKKLNVPTISEMKQRIKNLNKSN